jgi:hypothetical protein
VEQADGETRERERERRHAARMGAAARAPFLRRVEGAAENEEAVCVLCWRRFFHLQCHFLTDFE